MIVSLVAAMAENRVIGRDGGVPWHLPADMRLFKELTTGHAVVMGRKTFESLKQPLRNRRNIVVTRDRDYDPPPGVIVAHALDEAIAAAKDDDEVFIAGGEEIYLLALPRADRLYLTLVHADVEGDTFFPEFDRSEWRLVRDERQAADDRHLFPFSFRLYERRRHA